MHGTFLDFPISLQNSAWELDNELTILMIVIRLWARNTRNHFGFSSPENRPSLGPTQPSAKRVVGVNLGFEEDHSLPFSSKFKNEWSRASTRPYAFMEYTETILPLCTAVLVAEIFLLWVGSIFRSGTGGYVRGRIRWWVSGWVEGRYWRGWAYRSYSPFWAPASWGRNPRGRWCVMGVMGLNLQEMGMGRI